MLAQDAAVHFEGYGDIVALGFDAVKVVGDEGVYLADDAGTVGVGDIEGQGGIVHPE